MIDKTDLKWLRENHFRKQKNLNQWYTNWVDSRYEMGNAPFFKCYVVFHEPTKRWHAMVAMHKNPTDVNLVIMPNKVLYEEWGVPEHWNENDWSDFPLGYATCEKTAKDAVTKAVHRAAEFARWIMHEKYYNISDLERDFPMEKKEGRDAVGE